VLDHQRSDNKQGKQDITHQLAGHHCDFVLRKPIPVVQLQRHAHNLL
jgi:hypothetical protein